MSVPMSMTGEQLSLSQEYAIANWAGELLPETFETHEAAQEKLDAMVTEATAQGFTASASRLKILRREIREIAGAWIG